MRAHAADATLEALPNQIRVRHTRLTVRAPTSDEAIESAARLSLAMATAFASEGPATLSVDIKRRTTPVADRTTIAVADAMRIAAAVALLLGALLIVLGWSRFQAGPDRLPRQFWLLAALGSALALAPAFLPGEIIMALFFMAIPVSIAGVVLRKGIQVRHAAAWPSTRGRITRSKLRAQHHRQGADVTKVSNTADVEYEFALGDRSLSRHAHRHRRDRRGPPRRDAQSLQRRRHGAGVLRSEESGERRARAQFAPAGRLALCDRRRSLPGRPRGAGVLLERVGHPGRAGGLFSGECLPAGHGFLHPGRAHDTGHAVGRATPGRRGGGLAGDRRQGRQKHRRALSQAGRRRAERHDW